MKLDSALGSTEMCPGKQRKTKVDGCGVQGIGSLSKVDPNVFSGIEILSPLDEDLSKVPENPPIPALVGIGQGASCDFPTDSGMVQFAFHSAQTGNNISQTLPESQLSEEHDGELSITTERPNPTIPLISIDTVVEFVSRKEIQQLKKNYSSIVHRSTPRPLSGVGPSAKETFSFQIEKTFLPRRRIYSS